MDKQFENQTVLITGAGSGIGRASALDFARQGARVSLLARHLEKVEEAAAEIRQSGGQAWAAAADVGSSDQIEAAVRETEQQFGGIDVLVTCAAAEAAQAPSETLSLAGWNAIIQTDLTGAFLSCQAAGRSMLGRGYGRIVNLASFHVVATYPQRAAYVAAKCGVVGLTQALAVEWGGRGITVNAVAPGPILTPRTKWFLSQSPENQAGMIGRTPAGRLGATADVTAAILFLASKEAVHVNGQTLVIDGGWTRNAWWGKHPFKG